MLRNDEVCMESTYVWPRKAVRSLKSPCKSHEKVLDFAKDGKSNSAMFSFHFFFISEILIMVLKEFFSWHIKNLENIDLMIFSIRSLKTHENLPINFERDTCQAQIDYYRQVDRFTEKSEIS